MNLRDHAETFAELIEAAEQSSDEVFEVLHLSLESERELLLVLIVGDNLDGEAAVLEGIRMMSLERRRLKEAN